MTGLTSLATGYVEGVQRSGTAGTLSLRTLTGTFQAGETLETTTGTGTTGTTPGQALAVGNATPVAGWNGGRATVSANINLINSNSTWTIDDGADAVDLLVSGNISDDSSTDPGVSADFIRTSIARDITINGEGTVQLDGNNTHDRTILQNKLTILGSGDALASEMIGFL